MRGNGRERERERGDPHNCSNTGIQLVGNIKAFFSPRWEREVEEDAKSGRKEKEEPSLQVDSHSLKHK